MEEGSVFTQQQLDLLDFDFYIDRFKARQNARASKAMIEKFKQDPKCFTPLENLLIQFVLTRIVAKLLIINDGCAKRFIGLSKIDWGTRMSCKKRIEIGAMHEHIFYSPTIQKMKEGMIAVFYTKISHDVQWCIDTFKTTELELQETGRCDSLPKTVEDDQANELEEFQLIEEYTRNKHYFEYLETQLADYKQNSEIRLTNVENHILKLEDAILDTRLRGAIQTRLICKWEQNRFSQGSLMLSNEEKHLNNQLNDARDKLDVESRAINEIENFLKLEIDHIEDMTKFWQNKYEKEIEQLDDKIQMATENITELQRRYEEMKELYEAREAEIYDYWTKKRLEAEAEILAQKKWKCAIKIQAWWRGTMVRRHLGPYKKKRKGKGGKGGKGKKK